MTPAWLEICQGLLVIGWGVRLLSAIIRAAVGETRKEPTGALGVFVALVWYFVSGLVLWRSGGISTIAGVL